MILRAATASASARSGPMRKIFAGVAYMPRLKAMLIRESVPVLGITL